MSRGEQEEARADDHARQRENDDDRWLVVDGRRWRRQDPELPKEVAERLLSHLGRGRSGVRAMKAAGQDPAPARRRVDLAKHGLGERGTPWWEQTAPERQARWQDALARLEQLDEPASD
jgi:hypothetical protein